MSGCQIRSFRGMFASTLIRGVHVGSVNEVRYSQKIFFADKEEEALLSLKQMCQSHVNMIFV